MPGEAVEYGSPWVEIQSVVILMVVFVEMLGTIIIIPTVLIKAETA